MRILLLLLLTINSQSQKASSPPKSKPNPPPISNLTPPVPKSKPNPPSVPTFKPPVPKAKADPIAVDVVDGKARGVCLLPSNFSLDTALNDNYYFLRLNQNINESQVLFLNFESWAFGGANTRLYSEDKRPLHPVQTDVLPFKIVEFKDHDSFETRFWVEVFEKPAVNATVTASTFPPLNCQNLTDNVWIFSHLVVTPGWQRAGKIIGYLLEGIAVAGIIIVAFFMPCLPGVKCLRNDWAVAVSSTVIMIQMIMMSGLISENFGGPINIWMENMMEARRWAFLDDLKLDTQKKWDTYMYRAGIWKLEETGYLPSIFLENYLTCILLGVTILGCFLTPPKSDANEFLKKMRLGSTLVFMIPLHVTCLNCFVAVFYNGLTNVFAIISLLGATIVLLYYIFFAYEIHNPRPNSVWYFSTYAFMNFDFPIVYATTVVPFVEYYMMWIGIVLEMLMADFSYFPLIVMIILYVCLLVFLTFTPRRPRSEDFREVVIVNILKRLAILSRCFLMILLGVLVYQHQKTTYSEIRLYTIGVMVLSAAEVIAIIAIIVFRIKGFSRKGIENKYIELIDLKDSPSDDYAWDDRAPRY